MTATASQGEIERFRLQRGDVLITKDSEAWDDIGVPSLVAESAEVAESADAFSLATHLALLRPFKEILGSYLARALQSKAVAYQFHVRGEWRDAVRHYSHGHPIRSDPPPLPPPNSATPSLPGPRGPAHPPLRQRQTEAHRAAGGGAAGRRQPCRHPRPRPNVRLKPSGVEWLGDVPEHWEMRRGKRLFIPSRELARPNDIQLSATQALRVIPQDEYEQRVSRRIVKISLHLNKRPPCRSGRFCHQYAQLPRWLGEGLGNRMHPLLRNRSSPDH